MQDPPENALSTLGTTIRDRSWPGSWPVRGELFYIYQRSDTELAVMNRPFVPIGYKSTMQQELGFEEVRRMFSQSHELLIIPVPYSSRLHTLSRVAVQMPETPAFDESNPFAALLNTYAQSALTGQASPFTVFALHDINGDGSPELFIGFEDSNGFIHLNRIYTLQDGEPALIFQRERGIEMDLLTDDIGGYIIKTFWGVAAIVVENFFALDERGKLITLEILRTGILYFPPSTEYGYLRYRVVDVTDVNDALVDGEAVRITEEEYVALIRQYGSRGFFPKKISRPGMPTSIGNQYYNYRTDNIKIQGYSTT